METVPGFVVTTVCETVDDFVERYHSRVVSRTLFVGVIEPRALGGECAFAILLADRTVVLAGTCEVTDVYPHADNEYGSKGMRLAVRRLGPDSEDVWSALLARAKPLEVAIEAAIEAAMTPPAGAISSNDLSAYAFEFEEQTTVPLQRPAIN